MNFLCKIKECYLSCFNSAGLLLLSNREKFKFRFIPDSPKLSIISTESNPILLNHFYITISTYLNKLIINIQQKNST